MLKVKSGIKAGGLGGTNHSRRLMTKKGR